MNETVRRRSRRRSFYLLSLVAALASAGACGGELGGTNGGESHFLSYCDADCGAGLDCIQGLCTRSCLVAESSCDDLSSGAVCTDASVEPGEVAVCDVPCDTNADCRPLSEQYACSAGFCRPRDSVTTDGSGGTGAASSSAGSSETSGSTTSGANPSSGGSTAGAVTTGASGASSSGSSESSTSASTSAGSGAPCEVLFQEFPSGSSDIPNPAGCGTCACNDGQWSCSEEGCEQGTLVFSCPEEVVTDPVEVFPVRLEADSLTLRLVHGGGCQTHDYGLCYGEAFDESHPVQGSLQVIHDGHGDDCLALLSTEVTFDLSPYADYYNEAYKTEGGIIITNYGTYSFGDLSCQDRTLAAEAQAREAAQATLQEDGSAGPVCSSDADCEWASVDTTCSAACGAIVSTLRLDQFSTALNAIETHTCADFADECDPVVTPPCVAPPALACQNNTCVIAEP